MDVSCLGLHKTDVCYFHMVISVPCLGLQLHRTSVCYFSMIMYVSCLGLPRTVVCYFYMIVDVFCLGLQSIAMLFLILYSHGSFLLRIT